MTGSLPTLGGLLRAVRERHGWTLKEMSDRTGIPRSTLAKVEHDRLTLGYDKLLQISQRLKMRLSELISPGDEPEPRALTRRSIGTVATALRVETPHYEYYFMCPDLSRKKMIPIFGRVHAKSIDEFGELMKHAGEEFIFVLTGRVQEASLVAGCTSEDENLIDSLARSKPREVRQPAQRAAEPAEKPTRKTARQKAHRR
jgi:transcriptional regulator with XRE-family HTH domain